MGTEEYSANLRRSIRQLQERAAVKTGLKALPKRGAITAKVQTGKRTASGGTTIKSPITETAGSRTYYGTPKTITSSDGLFVLVYRNTDTVTTVDAAGNPVVFVYDNVS
jgi:hypothetical protein